jgi:2-phosphoglycerate kinase
MQDALAFVREALWAIPIFVWASIVFLAGVLLTSLLRVGIEKTRSLYLSLREKRISKPYTEELSVEFTIRRTYAQMKTEGHIDESDKNDLLKKVLELAKSAEKVQVGGADSPEITEAKSKE